MSISVEMTLMESYFTSSPGNFFESAGGWAENISRALGIGANCARLGQEISLLQNNTVAAGKWGSVADSFDAAEGTNNIIRVIYPIERLLTGKMFWKRNDDGTWFRVTEESETTTGLPRGAKVRRDFIEVLQDIIVLAARILSPISWLHSKSVYDLGKHADRMNHAITGLWGACITLGIIEKGLAIYGDTDENDTEDDTLAKRTKIHAANIACETLDLASLISGSGIFNANPTLRFVQIGLNLVSNGSYLIKEMALYS